MVHASRVFFGGLFGNDNVNHVIIIFHECFKLVFIYFVACYAVASDVRLGSVEI